MPVPEFVTAPNERVSLLPDGVYFCDATELYAAFVRTFPTSRTRTRIWAGFQELMRQPVMLLMDGTLWVDGSFVTGKLDPNDVDVVLFATAAALNDLSAESRSELRRLQDADWSQPRFRTHLFVVAVHAAGDARSAVFEALRCYWREWWGRTRRGTPKGFIRMIAGRPDLAPAIDETRCP
jgi:hypothetical protein